MLNIIRQFPIIKLISNHKNVGVFSIAINEKNNHIYIFV